MMDSIKRWLFKSSDQVSNHDVEKSDPRSTEGNEEQTTIAPKQIISSKSNHEDPHVAEFFKEFPEPYRKKLIKRFSTREGFYQFDFIRDLAMQREYDYAARGISLEEKREKAEFQAQLEKEAMEQKQMEFLESRKNRVVPDWEKKLQNVIPLHESENMQLKLFQATNMSIIGILTIVATIRAKKSQPSMSKFSQALAAAGAVNVCVFCQTAAYYRLMDWGIFDRSVDDRDALTKSVDEFTKSFLPMIGISKNKDKPDT